MPLRPPPPYSPPSIPLLKQTLVHRVREVACIALSSSVSWMSVLHWSETGSFGWDDSDTSSKAFILFCCLSNKQMWGRHTSASCSQQLLQVRHLLLRGSRTCTRHQQHQLHFSPSRCTRPCVSSRNPLSSTEPQTWRLTLRVGQHEGLELVMSLILIYGLHLCHFVTWTPQESVSPVHSPMLPEEFFFSWTYANSRT